MQQLTILGNSLFERQRILHVWHEKHLARQKRSQRVWMSAQLEESSEFQTSM